MVEFPSNGQTAAGYVATPHSGAGPGVVVIQEYWGLVPHIKDVCDRLAREGFSALAVDLYHGDSTTEPDEAGKKMMALRMADAGRDMSAAVTWLLSSGRASGDTVGTVGFCMGGGLALYLATLRPEVRACVIYYGVFPSPWADFDPDLSRINGAVLGHFGDSDPYTTTGAAAELEQRIRAAGKEVEFHWYPGCGHAFFRDTTPDTHNPEAAQLSWDRTLALFRRQLGPDATR
jgi:carboxymethylenebutenolidase